MIDKPSRRSTNHLSLILRFVDQAFEFFSCDNNQVRDNTDANLSLVEGRGQKAEGRREERIKKAGGRGQRAEGIIGSVQHLSNCKRLGFIPLFPSVRGQSQNSLLPPASCHLPFSIKNCTSVFAALVKRRIVSASAGDTKRHSFNLTFLEVGFSCLLASFGLGKLNLVVEGV